MISVGDLAPLPAADGVIVADHQRATERPSVSFSRHFHRWAYLCLVGVVAAVMSLTSDKRPSDFPAVKAFLFVLLFWFAALFAVTCTLFLLTLFSVTFANMCWDYISPPSRPAVAVPFASATQDN